MSKNSTFKIPPDNIYGRLDRLNWIIKNTSKKDIIVDLGCGTGYNLTIPLMHLGYNIIGIDRDAKSIKCGRKIAKKYNLDSEKLLCKDFQEINFHPDAVILSEVLEHLNNNELKNILDLIFSKLKNKGKLLITVPNGYSWFELESFLWYKIKFGKILKKLWIEEAFIVGKYKLFGIRVDQFVSSLDSSPHIQKFSPKKLSKILTQHGFNKVNLSGGSFFSGPFSSLIFSGIKIAMNLNLKIGKLFPSLASGFYITVEKP